MFNRILLAVDGSEHALHAAKVAADMAHCMKSAELRIVVAYETIPSYLGEPNLQLAINALLNEAQMIMKKAVELVENSHIEAHSELVEGSPAEAILEVAKTRESDIIIMGSRGLGRLAGLLLGSTSQKVVSHAPCPVLIVR
jgi:nucleotide-binding universal stress UspA family protein